MTELPFDLDDPPETPPATVAQPMLWRAGHRIHRDHRPAAAGHQRGPGAPGRRPRCAVCRDPWPCAARRLAERALVASLYTAHTRPVDARAVSRDE